MSGPSAHRVAIVCGASRGIGKAVAQRLACDGLRLLLVARDRVTLEATADAIAAETGAECLPLVGDVTEPRLAAYAVETALARWGRLDVLVNNAGGPRLASLPDLTDADWRNALELSLLSAVRFTSAALPAMVAARWGRIVNITSTVAIEPTGPMVLSATARAGLHAFAKAVSSDVAQHGVTVNCVAPGGTRTDRFDALLAERAAKAGRSRDDLLAERTATVPARRFAAPSEIAAVVAFLVSDGAGYVTGQVLVADGGLTRGT